MVVTVTNEDDLGTVTLSSVQPKVGFDLVATLTDEDGSVKDVKWQWYEGPISTSEPPELTENIIAKAKSATYTPKATDADPAGPKTLWVRVAYTDAFGSTSAIKGAANPVEVDQENRAPEFKDDNGKVITSDTRSIAENAVMGSEPTPDVGDLVPATDPNGVSTTPEGRLTYTLGGRDASSFEIAAGTGQITVKAGTMLDFETKKSYTVTVTATDPSQATATITITINVTDVNESPVIDGGGGHDYRERCRRHAHHKDVQGE